MCHNDYHDERADERDREMAAEALAYYRAHPGYRRAARHQGPPERDMAADAADYYRAHRSYQQAARRQRPVERDMDADAADYYRAQGRGYRQSPPRQDPEQHGETRHFNHYEPIPGEWSAHPHDAEPMGGPPPGYDQDMGDPAATYQARWHHRGHGPRGFRGGPGFRGGRGFFGPWLLIPLLILLTIHSPLVGAVLLPFAALGAIWPLLLIGGAFLFFRRHAGFRRW